MASEDSLAHFLERSEPLSAFALWIHRVGLLDDPDEPAGIQMFLALHHFEDLSESLEGCPFATYRRNVLLEERDNLLNQILERRDREDEHSRISRFWKDSTGLEDFSSEFQNRPTTRVLVEEELWIYEIAKPSRGMLLDADAKRALAFDETRQKVLNTFATRESFLLIACTHHVVTSAPNYHYIITSLVVWDPQAFQHIAEFDNGPSGGSCPVLPL